MQKKIQPLETTGDVDFMVDQSDKIIISSENYINEKTKSLNSVDVMLEQLCKKMSLPFLYNLAELFTILEEKKLLHDYEMERLNN